MSLLPHTPMNVSLAADITGQYVALYSKHSNIKIWNSSNGKKFIELQVKAKKGSYSVVSWSIRDLYIRNSKNIIWLSAVSEFSDELSHKILAYGTTSGCVGLMYALINREIVSSDSVHSSCIQDVVWNKNCSQLYSSADDKTIVEWTISEDGFTPGRRIQAWKKSVGKLALSCDGNFLVAASTRIRIWDIQNEVVVRKLTGHTSQVNCLELIHNGDGSISHVISVGEDERMISVQRVQLENSFHHISTLRSPHHPISMHISEYNTVFIVASNGIVYMYELPFDIEPSKPINHVWSLQISDISQSNGAEKSLLMPIMSVFCLKEEGNLLVMYGNLVRPIFEKIAIDLSQKRMNLERCSKQKSSLNVDIITEVKSSSNTAVPIQLMSSHLSKKVKRKRPADDETSSEQVSDVSLGELVSEREENSKKDPEAPRSIATGSLVHMLCQSLQSDDSDLFNQVISVTLGKTIQNTVKSLPMKYVLPFIVKVMSIMHTTPYRGPSLMKWIRPCLTLHTAYLLTVPDLTDRLGMLYELLDSRAANYDKLCQLKGKLDLLANTNRNATPPTRQYSPIKPRLVFEDNDDSSSEADLSESNRQQNNSRDESADELMT
ncbi:WD repeat-containing protein 43 [Oopsacas minuta]|uniref:WD repeat-containing protein 43 n=1 Tax=Oopsacas minuta TaxID=111878 RepID=A0AAV7K503_9METZ|nr:WD repeat-containing protein 43 [Oopsacas minuta]